MEEFAKQLSGITDLGDLLVSIIWSLVLCIGIPDDI